MNPRASLKAATGCLTMLALFIVLASYLSTGTLNPMAVYSSKSLLGKVAVSVGAVLMGGVLLQATMLGLLRLQLRVSTGQHPDDLICPGCGQSLMQFIGSHGTPMCCPRCRTWWHNGPACYSKELDRRLSVPLLPCPHCRKRAAQPFGYLSESDDTSIG